MSVPYAKNMAVEYAAKTIKGTEIDGKFDSTDTTIETIQSDIEALEQALAGKVVFDGELTTTLTDGYKPTLTADTLEYLYENHNTGGVFKLKNANGNYQGILSYNSVQMQDDDYSFSSGMWLYGDMYKKFGLTSGPLVLWDLPDVIKPIYWHTIHFQRGGTAALPNYHRAYGHMIILNNDSEPITISKFLVLIKTSGFKGVVFNGKLALTGGTDLTTGDFYTLVRLDYYSSFEADAIYLNSDNVERSDRLSLVSEQFSYFEDLGANRIN